MSITPRGAECLRGEPFPEEAWHSYRKAIENANNNLTFVPRGLCAWQASHLEASLPTVSRAIPRANVWEDLLPAESAP